MLKLRFVCVCVCVCVYLNTMFAALLQNYPKSIFEQVHNQPCAQNFCLTLARFTRVIMFSNLSDTGRNSLEIQACCRVITSHL